MTGFLDAILAFPTVLFTIPLGVVLCYWVTVMLGAVGVDVLDGDLSGAAKAAGGALEGGAKAVGGALGSGAEGALEGSAKAAGEALHAKAGILEGLGLGGVPVTVSFSTVVVFSWLLSLLTGRAAHEAVGGVLPGVAISGGVALLSLGVGLVLAGVAVRPLRPLFAVRQAPGRAELMGRVCTIASGRVDGKFGHATVEDGGAGLLLHVYCEKRNEMMRGDQALILGYDAARDAYEVEPVDWLLPEELQNLKDPSAAAALVRARERVR